MISKKACWAAGVFIIFAGVALGQGTTTSIKGEVKGEDGKPLKDALIKITRLDIKGNYKVKTGKRGDYYYGGLPLGNYDVTLEIDGKEVDSVRKVRTRIGEPTEVNFDVQDIRRRQAELQRNAEAGTLSKEDQRRLSPEQRAQLEAAAKEKQAVMAKNKALNEAFTAGLEAFKCGQTPGGCPPPPPPAGSTEVAVQAMTKADYFSKAVDSFKKATEIADTPQNQRVVWSNLASAYVQLAMTKSGAEQESTLNQGLAAYQKAIEIAPTDAPLHNDYALALARAKKFKEAEAELQKAAELDPPSGGKYYYNLGAVLVNAGQYDPAGEAFKKAIELTPSYAEAHYQYAVCLSSKMTTDASGKVIAPPGMKEELAKYLELAPTGPNADAAKAMLSAVEGSVQTQYTNPEASKPAKKTPKKK